MRRIRIALAFGGLTAAVAAPGAKGAVVVGMTAPTTPSAICSGPSDEVQDSPAFKYVIPEGIASPVITRWSTSAAAGSGQQLALKVFEKAGEPATYRQVSHDGPRALTGGMLNTFTTKLPVQPGQFLGVGTPPGSGPNACIFGTEIGSRHRSGFLNDGESAGPFAAQQGLVNVSAVVEPSNDFTIGSIVRNRRKGTARISVTLPGPGSLVLSGRGVRAQLAARSGPLAEKTVSSAGTVTLPVKAKGQKLKRLKRTGRVKVGLSITYTPTGGSPASQALKVKLRRKPQRA